MPDDPLPHTGQPVWEQAQSAPWLTQGNMNRTFDAFSVHIVVSSVEVSPPGACDDGERFLIDDSATGEWAGEDGGVAIAVGENATNGWIIIPAALIEHEGNEYYNVEEATKYIRQSAAWVEQTGGAGSAVVITDTNDYTMLAADVNSYIRLTAAGTKQIIIQDDTVEPLPANGEWHFRNVQGGLASIVPDIYVTVNLPTDGSLDVPVGGTITLKRVAANEFDLFGLVS